MRGLAILQAVVNVRGLPLGVFSALSCFLAELTEGLDDVVDLKGFLNQKFGLKHQNFRLTIAEL